MNPTNPPNPPNPHSNPNSNPHTDPSGQDPSGQSSTGESLANSSQPNQPAQRSEPAPPARLDIAAETDRVFAGVKPTDADVFNLDGRSSVSRLNQPGNAPYYASKQSLPGSYTKFPLSNQSTKEVPPPLPYQGVNDFGLVIADVPCRGCGYQLRGLSMAEVCPECRWPIERSVSGANLIHSPPSHIRSLYQGLTIAVVATLGAILATLIGVFSVIAISTMPINIAPNLLELVGAILGALAAMASLYGWWVFSIADPALADSEQPKSARRILRISTIISLFFTLVFLVGQTLSITGVVPIGSQFNLPINATTTITIGTLVEVVLFALGFISGIAAVAQLSASMAYLAHIAMRFPSPSIETQARRLVWLSWVLYFPGVLLCGLGPLISFVLYIICVIRARSAIKAILDEQEFQAVVRAR